MVAVCDIPFLPLTRPAYLELCSLKAQFPQVPMAALTVGAGAQGCHSCASVGLPAVTYKES